MKLKYFPTILFIFCFYASAFSQHGSEGTLNSLEVKPRVYYPRLYYHNLDSSMTVWVEIKGAKSSGMLAPGQMTKELECQIICKTGGWKIYTRRPNDKGKMKEYLLSEMPLPDDPEKVKYVFSTTNGNAIPIFIADCYFHKPDSLDNKQYWDLNVRPFDPKKDILP